MCYTCSPDCDNCSPKLMRCPSCCHVNRLSQTVCAACGKPLNKTEKELARERWQNGERLGGALTPHAKPLSRTNSPFVLNK